MSGDLMIVQGPLYLNWSNSYLEHAGFESFQPFIKDRLKYWESAHVHVKGRPEWVFVKLHTHGMQSEDAYKNGNFRDLCAGLDDVFTKNEAYRLHYVTAREAYNIIKAAEDGMTGNPNEYRNYIINEPANKKIYVNKPYTLERYSKEEILITIEEPGKNTVIYIKYDNILEITGNDITKVRVSLHDGALKELDMDGSNCKYEEHDL